jgi:putative Mn2+ efflux pump MntP
VGFWEIFLLAIGLSMDAFAVAVCLGLNMKKATVKKSLIVGLYFGIFQGVMPVIGYFIGSLFASKIEAFDHWLAFGLLSVFGIKMIWNAFKKEIHENKETSLHPKKMVPLAIATSIDALAVGISLAFLGVNIYLSAVLIGVTTLVLSFIGVKIGNIFGLKLKSKAEFIGGVILILIGLKILLEHVGTLF